MSVRTRFAPSPTGFLHVGGVRTAIFAYLLAKRHKGEFLLRIEDTDRERLVPGAIAGIVREFKWLGIEIDEGPSLEELKSADPSWTENWGIGGPAGPYIQSHRLPRYKEVAEQLVASGHAYRCDCSSQQLEEERQIQMAKKEPPGYAGRCRTREVSPDSKHVIRLKVPHNETVVLDDAVKGKVRWEGLALRDSVLLKSDGFPTYHLAHLVDDHDMKITHVIRAEEWLPSAPLHLLTYKALGWTPPILCHPPVVLGQDGKKLSKRHGATFVSAFRDDGYLPEALFNFLVLIGWSPGEGEEQEIFTKEELISRFSLEHISSSPGIFSYDKLNWMNGIYIRNLAPADLAQRVIPFLKSAGVNFDPAVLERIIPHIKERMVVLKDAVGLIEFLFTDTLNRDLDQMFNKNIDRDKARQIVTRGAEVLSTLENFTAPEIDSSLKGIASELGLPAGGVLLTTRIAVTGKKATPPLVESMEILGKERSVRRLQETAALLQ